MDNKKKTVADALIEQIGYALYEIGQLEKFTPDNSLLGLTCSAIGFLPAYSYDFLKQFSTSQILAAIIFPNYELKLDNSSNKAKVIIKRDYSTGPETYNTKYYSGLLTIYNIKQDYDKKVKVKRDKNTGKYIETEADPDTSITISPNAVAPDPERYILYIPSTIKNLEIYAEDMVLHTVHKVGYTKDTSADKYIDGIQNSAYIIDGHHLNNKIYIYSK